MPQLGDPSEKRIFTIPNLLSVVHVAILPLIYHFLKEGTPRATTIAAALITIGASTDILDGFIARRFGQTSNLGRILDPLADKAFTIALMIFLVGHRDLPLWYLLVVICRDVAIGMGGIHLILKKRFVSESNTIGKIASFLFFPVIITHTLKLEPWALATLWCSFCFIVLSTASYAKQFIALASPAGVKQT